MSGSLTKSRSKRRWPLKRVVCGERFIHLEQVITEGGLRRGFGLW